MRSVYLCQSNNLYGNNAFLPYSVGLLQAYAQTIPVIKENYAFKGFIYLREPIDGVIARLESPNVFGISVYIWNASYSTALAKSVKEAYPECLVVVGGPHIPVKSENFFKENPFIDIIVHYEGELAFADILVERLGKRDYATISGLSVNMGGVSVKTASRSRVDDLDKLPSPYLSGVFDELMNDPYEKHPTFESNRGCPYQCTFCVSEDTLVETTDGDKQIKDIQPDDLVLGWDETLIWNSIERSVYVGEKLVQRVEAGKKYIEATDDHHFYTKKGWKPVSLDDEVFTELGWTKVTSITPAGIKKVYDLFNALPTHNFFANGILVSNCDWGSNTYAKVKKFGDERLMAEIDWFGDNKCDLLYSADANFGIFERDVALTQKMIETKKRTGGFPNKFRAAYAKNSGERVYTISKMLNDAGMSKGATLSFQSMDEHTLDVIKRKNIGIEVFKGLMKKYRAENIPTYSEIIIGLAGETYNSFADGLDTLIRCGQHDSVSIYLCEVLPNSEMNDPEYRAKHGIKSVRTPVLFYHGSPSNDPHKEFYELVTETATLPPKDWLKCQMLSWAVQCFHCLSLTQCIAVFFHAHAGIPYRTFYESLLKFYSNGIIRDLIDEASGLFWGITEGKEWGIIDNRFGDIVWPVEEGSFLKAIAVQEQFYHELRTFVSSLCEDEQLVDDLIEYQQHILASPHPVKSRLDLSYNIHEFIESAYQNESIELKKTPSHYLVERRKEYESLPKYAKEVVWYNRKGGWIKERITILNHV